jgi:tetratricopeptide (TPR) repeat protein
MKEKLIELTTSLLRKATLVLCGVVLFFVFLEAGLRLGGFILSSIQESGNLRSIKQKGTYRILCLGESTTQGQYPKPLEQVLNQRNIGVRFGVIDKGKVATNTTFILNRVESYLAEYRPDMVVAMMGNNDKQVTYYEDIPESDAWFFRHCRVYRFGRILCMQLLKKLRKKDIYGLGGSNSGRKAKTESVWSIAARTAFANEIPTEKAAPSDSESEKGSPGPNRRSSGAEKSLRPIVFEPKTDRDYVGQGQRLYHEEGKASEAEASFKKAIEINPKNEEACLELGQLYRLQDILSQAEDSYRKAIELNPESDKAYHGLGWVYTDQGKLAKAQDFFKKASELRSKKVTEINPKNVSTFIEAGDLYRLENKLSLAEDILKKGLELNPGSKPLLRAMASLYGEMGKPELAKEYTQKADQLGSEDQSAVTVNNYRKLKEILDRNGIKLVCVQYPMRNVEPLKKIFENDKGVLFVDNESLFKEAVKKNGYKKYFRDMFAGDFGHCTPKGNELLAQNIADVILKEVFKR